MLSVVHDIHGNKMKTIITLIPFNCLFYIIVPICYLLTTSYPYFYKIRICINKYKM